MSQDSITMARTYAEAYAAFDPQRLREVLAADLQFRQVNPGGYRELSGAEAFIADTAAALTHFTSHAALAAKAEPVGDRIATTSRMKLTGPAGSYLLEHLEVVTVGDGQIVAIDGVCTGVRPA